MLMVPLLRLSAAAAAAAMRLRLQAWPRAIARALRTWIVMVWLSLNEHRPYSVVRWLPLASLEGYTALVGRPDRADTSRYSMVVNALVASQ